MEHAPPYDSEIFYINLEFLIVKSVKYRPINPPPKLYALFSIN